MRRARPKVSCFFPLLALLRRMEGLNPAFESGAIYQFMTHDYDRLDSAVIDSIGLCIRNGTTRVIGNFDPCWDVSVLGLGIARARPTEPVSNNRSPLTIFLSAFIFRGLVASIPAFQVVLILEGRLNFLTTSAGFFGGLSLLDLISIVLFPILFSLLLYSLGGRIDISKEYRIVAFSLFVGGASGNLAGYLIGLLYYRVIALPVTSSIVASPPPIGLEPLFAGLNSFFAGFSAIALSNFRARERKFGIVPPEIATSPRSDDGLASTKMRIHRRGKVSNSTSFEGENEGLES